MVQTGPDLKSRASKIKKWLRYSQNMKNSLFWTCRFSSRSSEPVHMGDFKPLEITLSPTAKYTTGVV